MKALARLLEPAFDVIDARADKTTAQQINVCEVPAPTFHEAHRARYVQKLLRGSSLKDIHTDEVGTLNLTHLTNTIRAIAMGAETIIKAEATPTRVDPATVN